jgi:hypothetical protein
MIKPIIDAVVEERWRGLRCESGFSEVVLDVAKE